MIKLDRGTRAKIYLRLVEYTSIPAYIGIYLLFLSGYGMITRKVTLVTFGILTRYHSEILHAISPFPYIIGLLIIIHAVAGLGCLIMRRIKGHRLTLTLEIINLVLGAIFAGQLTILEFL